MSMTMAGQWWDVEGNFLGPRYGGVLTAIAQYGPLPLRNTNISFVATFEPQEILQITSTPYRTEVTCMPGNLEGNRSPFSRIGPCLVTVDMREFNADYDSLTLL
jgi:hypothetical protein